MVCRVRFILIIMFLFCAQFSVAFANEYESSAQTFDGHFKAENYLFNKQYEEAINIYSELLIENERDSASYIGRGFCYEMLGNLDESTKDYEKAFAINKAITLHFRATYYQDVKYYDKAINDCNEVIKLMPNSGDSFELRSLIYSQKGDFDKALLDAEKASLLENHSADAILNRGFVLKASGKYDKALEDYKAALELVPQNSFNALVILNAMGDCYAVQEQYDQALLEFERAEKINTIFSPIKASLYFNMAQLYEIKNDRENAMKYYKLGKENNFQGDVAANREKLKARIDGNWDDFSGWL